MSRFRFGRQHEGYRLVSSDDSGFSDAQFEEPPPKIPWKAISLASFLFLVLAVIIRISASDLHAICTEIVLEHFICPAIVHPETHGVVEVPVSYIARFNLMQIELIIRKLCLTNMFKCYQIARLNNKRLSRQVRVFFADDNASSSRIRRSRGPRKNYVEDSEDKPIQEKYELCLEDEAEAAARAGEACRCERRDALLSALRAQRAARAAAKAHIDAQRAARSDHSEALRAVDLEIERATAESQQLKHELEAQAMCVAERTRLLDEVDYAHRVLDSKRALAEQIAKMVLSKETELALWQKKTLASCVEFKQGLIHLSAQFPDLAQTIDEKELMGAECAGRVSAAVAALRARAAALAARRAEHARERSALARKRANMLDQTRHHIDELKVAVTREQEALDSELAKENSEAVDWTIRFFNF